MLVARDPFGGGLRRRAEAPGQIPLAIAEAVAKLRRERRTQEHIACELGLSKATVSRILKQRGLSRLSDLEPQKPTPRYERESPGEIIHTDIKKPGRFNAAGHRITGGRRGHSNLRGGKEAPGWEFAHAAIDGHSRIATAGIFPEEKKTGAIAFLKAAACYRSSGVTVDRIMTGSGSYCKSFAFAKASKRLGVKHIRTKPYTPQTNGKAEGFIQTALREWA